MTKFHTVTINMSSVTALVRGFAISSRPAALSVSAMDPFCNQAHLAVPSEHTVKSAHQNSCLSLCSQIKTKVKLL